MAHEGEEGGDTEGFVAVADNFEKDRIMIEEDTEPGDDGVNGDHPQDTDDTVPESNPISDSSALVASSFKNQTHWRCSMGLL